MSQVTLAELLPPVTSDEVLGLLLETLQGIGPVQQVGTGAGVVVPSGAPINNYDFILTITTGGAPGTGAFTYSTDDGETESGPFTIPSSGNYGPIGGVQLSFAGVFNQGDQYVFQTIFPPFPVSDWESGSGGRTLVQADASAIADLSGTAIPNIAAGGLNQYAKGNWLTLLAAQVYENERFDPGATVVQVVLTLAATAPALTINAGDIIVSDSPGSNGHQFSNLSGTTISPGTSVALSFVAAQPGSAFNVQNGTLNVLVTPKPGLTANNPAPGTSAVSHAGSGGGTVTPSGSPNGNYSVEVLVTTSGALGAAVVQISIDGGNNFASPLTVPASGTYQIPLLNGLQQTGVTVTFAGSFVSGDTYSFTSYDSAVLVPGVDEESDPALQARDSGKWSGLGLGGGTNATFDYLCRSTPSGGSEVTRTSEQPDTVTAGQVDVVVAGYNGPVSSGALSNITANVAKFTGLTAKAVVSNALTQTINVVAQVYVTAAQQAAVQAAISAAFNVLQASTPIGGLVAWSDIEGALDQKQAGVIRLYLTSPAPNTDTQLPPFTVPLFNLAGVSYVIV